MQYLHNLYILSQQKKVFLLNILLMQLYIYVCVCVRLILIDLFLKRSAYNYLPFLSVLHKNLAPENATSRSRRAPLEQDSNLVLVQISMSSRDLRKFYSTKMFENEYIAFKGNIFIKHVWNN